jgi:hypothetical protein
MSWATFRHRVPSDRRTRTADRRFTKLVPTQTRFWRDSGRSRDEPVTAERKDGTRQSEPEALLKRFAEAINAHDLDAIVSLPITTMSMTRATES